MKTYLISVCLTAIIISLCEFILPQGRMKNAVWTVVSVLFAITLIKPILNFNVEEIVDFDKYIDNYSDSKTVGYFDEKEESYLEKYYKQLLFEKDIVAEKVKVEISRMNILKIEVYLSNLVIGENNEHINNSVICDYVAKTLNVDTEKVIVYV